MNAILTDFLAYICFTYYTSKGPFHTEEIPKSFLENVFELKEIALSIDRYRTKHKTPRSIHNWKVVKSIACFMIFPIERMHA